MERRKREAESKARWCIASPTHSTRARSPNGKASQFRYLLPETYELRNVRLVRGLFSTNTRARARIALLNWSRIKPVKLFWRLSLLLFGTSMTLITMASRTLA